MLNGHVVEKSIVHAESRYDPVKAHEYYERTKQLKGRGRRGKLSDKQKAGVAYTKHVVGEDRKQALERAAQENKASVEQLRQKAQARREEIRQKLQEIIEKLSEEASVTREKITDDVQAKIDALPDAPENLTKAQRSEFAAKRREEIAKIRGEAKGKRKDVEVYVKAKKKGERDISTAVREEVGAELKQSFEKAKKAYDSAKEEIKKKYEAEARREAEAVVANVE